MYRTLTFLIAMIWLANGLFCKLLNLVPRHQLIVERILGTAHAGVLTRLIGISEIIMALWIMSGRYSRMNAIVQILIIASMNILEFLLAPDLLLWGRFNIVFAFILIVVIFFNEFYLKPDKTTR